jgi:hypothetical protein
MSEHRDHAAMHRHSDEDLKAGIKRADEQRPRLEREGSPEQLEAHDKQRAVMEEELRQRKE